MPPKATASSSKGQQSLFAFFKPPTSSSSNAPAPAPSSSASKPKPKPVSTPAAAPKAVSTPKASTPKPAVASSSATKATNGEGVASSSTPAQARRVDSTPLTTSDKPEASSSQSVPAKRDAPIDSDEDEAPISRKRSTGNKPIIVDSDSDDSDVKPKIKAKAKSKAKDDDAFSGGSVAESENYFDDDLDDDLLDDSIMDVKPIVAKPKPAPKKAAPAPAPKKPSTNGKSSAVGNIKTQAEASKQQAKETKASNESVFSFLVDPKDAEGVRPGEDGYDPRTLYIPKSAWKMFTPFETQFWEIKQNHYDTVLFFQKGKFFELYEEDASIGHREFDLKLTDRVKMKMVGVPESSFDYWAAKFLAQGFKVGRVDQCETALGAELRAKDAKAKSGSKGAVAKQIVRRELKTVLTSGTIVDGALLTDDLGSHCVAIKEFAANSSSAPTFGVCVLDASTAEFSLSSFEDDTCRTQIETLIRQLKPKELIHEKGNLSVSTLRLLRSALAVDCQWTALKAGTEFLRPDATIVELKKLFKPKLVDEDGEAMEVEDEDEETEEARIPDNIRQMYGKPIAMSALGGMIWYLRQLNLDSDLITAKNFNIYDPLSQGKALVLDGQTLAHIEVLQNSQGGIEGTLFQLLSRCITPFGKRLFKIWLCAPLRDVVGINDRLDAVEDILANIDFSKKFDSMVKGLPDLERLLSRIHAKSCKKAEFLKVVSSFETITEGLNSLASASEDFKSKGIPNLLRNAHDIEGLLESIHGIYSGDELLPVDGMDEGYERVRQKVDDIETELHEFLEKYKVSLKCKTLQFRDIGTKDIYQVQVPVAIKVPSAWTKMSNTKDFNRYYSSDIARLVQELKVARERKSTVVSQFQFRVYEEFDKDYPMWMETVKLVAELDCLVSLSKSSAALGEPAVRPEIVESDVAIIEFEELRHPCVLSVTTDFIPNDVNLGGKSESMILLTGPNMAGKSTMLRMTCAAIIMAQLGCFVPAAKARIAPVDAIYSRMGANDFIFANASTFKVEMDDCNKILTKATPRSLVILDELGRGTSTYDGMSIAFAVLHRLATHVGCIGFFATHFTSLTEDFAYHPQIRLCNMQTHVNDETRAVVFLYKLVNGSSPKSYGPHVASMAGLPPLLVQRAIAISQQFEASSRARERTMRANESLPLTAQADAAFLINLAKLGSIDAMSKVEKGQLLRTLKMIRIATQARRVVEDVPMDA